MQRRLRTLLPLSAVTLSLTVGTAFSAAASSDQRATAEGAAATAGVDLVTTLDASTRAVVDADLDAVGQPRLPADAAAFGSSSTGDAVTVAADGTQTVLESAASMDAQLSAAVPAGATTSSSATAAADKGPLAGLASTLAGCAGGVVGFDAVMSILEKRVSCWALVTFIGGKIGPGLATSCIAGAGGALATYMGVVRSCADSSSSSRRQPPSCCRRRSSGRRGPSPSS